MYLVTLQLLLMLNEKEVNTMKKKEYTALDIEIISFESDDVIVTSNLRARSVVDNGEAQDVADEVML